MINILPPIRVSRLSMRLTLLLLVVLLIESAPRMTTAQETPVYYALPTTYPLETGNVWEYREWVTNVDCTAGLSIDTLEQYYTKVEVVKTDMLGDKEHFRIRYLQTLEYPTNVPQYRDTVESHDWVRIENGDLWFAGYDSATTGLVTENSKIWKTGITGPDTFTVLTNEILVIDFPIGLDSYNNVWISSNHPVYQELARTVIRIDTLRVGDNMLPSYAVNYGYDKMGLYITTWFSAFGKTRFVSKLQYYDNFGNLIRKYRVSESRLVSFTPTTPITGVADAPSGMGMPSEFSLAQNYPNPFNPETNIEYTLARPAYVTVRIYNVLGQSVRTLAGGYREAGTHRLVWHGTNDAGLSLPGGLYIVSLETEGVRLSKKMIFLK